MQIPVTAAAAALSISAIRLNNDVQEEGTPRTGIPKPKSKWQFHHLLSLTLDMYTGFACFPGKM